LERAEARAASDLRDRSRGGAIDRFKTISPDWIGTMTRRGGATAARGAARDGEAGRGFCRGEEYMRTRTPGWLFSAATVCTLGLAAMSHASAASPDPAHNSRNVLDWAGTYEGVTPCADCPGIRMQLTLQRDGRFKLSTQYLGRQATPKTVRGRFTWNAAGNTVTLDDAGQGRQFRVGEGRLLQLDRDGGVPPWDAPGRVLKRQPE
jgi:hypothetical protein